MHKPLIGIYGRTNAGKSSLLNFLTDQSIAIVSPEPGTTTDPVRRAYEILGFAPVVFLDTAGLDDSSTLGTQRMARTIQTIDDLDLAILVVGERGVGEIEQQLISRFQAAEVPFVIVHNVFNDPSSSSAGHSSFSIPEGCSGFITSHLCPSERDDILQLITTAIPDSAMATPSFFGGRIAVGDVVIMVCPIDSEAPAGRLILPQVQAVRSALDEQAIAMVVQPSQLAGVLALCTQPRLIVTDSQLFGTINHLIPSGVELTSFSILLSELKGDPQTYKQGLVAIPLLRAGDRILMIENCSHQTSCDDIGRVKIPRLLARHTGISDLKFDFVSGRDPMPSDLSQYALIVQCGGCMVSRRMVQAKIRKAKAAGIPITNYGLLLRAVQ